jgi:phenylacetate-coenzyme A ligase PaaK-like adenylate-forming protein
MGHDISSSNGSMQGGVPTSCILMHDDRQQVLHYVAAAAAAVAAAAAAARVHACVCAGSVSGGKGMQHMYQRISSIFSAQ